MGNKSGSEPRPRLVIIGGSYAGLETFQALHKHFDIKIIDNKDFLELTPSMLFYYTGQLPHEKISLPYHDSIMGGSIIHGKAIELQSKAVVIQTTEGSKTVEFDYCLIATGAINAPAKPSFELRTLSNHRTEIKAFQDKVLKANKVLVRGGGVLGVEVAAELATLGKQVVLACRGAQILPRFPPKAQLRAKPCLDEVHVKIVDSEKEAVSIADFDLVYDCFGNTYPTEENILNKNFSNYRDEKGRVRVNEFFQVSDENFKPIKHIFALGDCCITQANEEKNIMNLKNAAKVLTHNLKELALKGQEGRLKFKQYPKEHKKVETVALISLGRRTLLVLGKKTIRGEFLTKMKKNYGPKKLKDLILKEKRGQYH